MPESSLRLQALRDFSSQLEEAVHLATRHAAGASDVQSWVEMCASLARQAVELRSMVVDPPKDTETAVLLSKIASHIKVLLDLQARLQAANRGALAQLLPQDELQTYTAIGRNARRHIPFG